MLNRRKSMHKNMINVGVSKQVIYLFSYHSYVSSISSFVKFKRFTLFNLIKLMKKITLAKVMKFIIAD